MATLALTLVAAETSVSAAQLATIDLITIAGTLLAPIVSLPFLSPMRAFNVQNNGSSDVVLARGNDASIAIVVPTGTTVTVLASGNTLGPRQPVVLPAA